MKTLNLITLLAIMLTTIYANAQCTDCGTTCGAAPNASGTCAFAAGDGAAASGNYSVGLGLDVIASGLNAVAIGNNAVASNTDAVSIGIGEASGSNSYSIGSGTANAVDAFAFGKRPHAYGDYSYAIGQDVLAHQDYEYNYIFGCGTGGSYMTNNISSSMMFGINSTVPTVFIQGSSGAGTWGKVGIGTTSPDGILHLLEESAVNTDFVIEKADTKEARVVFHNAGTEAAYISLDASENMMVRNSTSDKDIIFNINDGGSITEVMRVDGDVSRVGIGTTTPGQKLEVSGGNINVATSTNGYMINGALMLWNYGNTTDVFVGHSAGNSSMSGHNNTYIGTSSGNATSSGVNNTFVGFESGKANNTGTRNSFIGTNSGLANNSGQYNTFNGYNSGSSNTSGLYNTNIGRDAGWTNSTGSHNTMIGQQAGYDNTASNNTFVGSHAGENISSGSQNTCLGYIAGNTYTTVATGTFIGYNADANGNHSNCAAIGANAITTAPDMMYLGDANAEIYCAATNFTGSDGRFKFNVQENVSGLDFINRLRPVTYQLNTQEYDAHMRQNMPAEVDSSGNIVEDTRDFTRSMSKVHAGFIAQEVEQAATDVGFISSIVHHPTSETDPYAISYQQMVVPLVKAVQEQQAQIEELRNQLSQCCAAGSNKTDEDLGNRFNNDNATKVELGRSDDIILYQNIPNPFGDETTINFYLPETVKTAKIVFYDNIGKVIKEVSISQKGNASVIVRSSELSTGVYSYSLVVDEKIAGTKMMVKEK